MPPFSPILSRSIGRCASMIPSTGCRTDRISSAATTIVPPSIAIPRPGARTRKSISGPTSATSSLYEHHTTSLVFNDPPYHSRVRKLLAPAFTPRALKALQPRIEALVDRLLDRAAAQGGMDLIADFAAAIPLQLIGDMLGVPADERGPLRDWSLAILGALEPVLTAEQLAARHRGGRRLQALSARSRRTTLARAEPRRRRDPVQADRRQRACRRAAGRTSS